MKNYKKAIFTFVLSVFALNITNIVHAEATSQSGVATAPTQADLDDAYEAGVRHGRKNRKRRRNNDNRAGKVVASAAVGAGIGAIAGGGRGMGLGMLGGGLIGSFI